MTMNVHRAHKAHHECACRLKLTLGPSQLGGPFYFSLTQSLNTIKKDNIMFTTISTNLNGSHKSIISYNTETQQFRAFVGLLLRADAYEWWAWRDVKTYTHAEDAILDMCRMHDTWEE
jgi:hypothetical protein